MHITDAYNRAQPGLTLRDLKPIAQALGARLKGLWRRRIRVGPVSPSWRAEHERDAAKR